MGSLFATRSLKTSTSPRPVVAITDANKKVEQELSYDAWGRPRNPDTWELMPKGAANSLVNLNAMQPRFDRGYTGHEQMAGFGLINMNGRLYDPYLQRFLSPDNVVQDPLNAQSYNRYSYCLNNPLMYTDPSGWQMAPINQYWCLGKANTNQTRFNNYVESGSDGWSDYQNACMSGYTGGLLNYWSELDDQSKEADFNGTVRLVEYTDYYSAVSIDGKKSWDNISYMSTRATVTYVKTKTNVNIGPTGDKFYSADGKLLWDTNYER